MSIFRSGIIIAFLTFISRIFGLLRELVIANFFGTNMFADAVNTAFKFPNLFRRIFGEGALASVFVPIYSSELKENEKVAHQFAREIFTLLFISLVILTILMQIFMPQILTILAPGFIIGSEKFIISVLLCRITIPYMIFISMAALLGSIQNSHNKFASFAFIPILLNIAVISFAIIPGEDEIKTIYVAIGITIGGIFQFVFMYYMTAKLKTNIKLISVKSLSKDSYIFLKNMIPATLGSSVTQLNLFISQAIASFAEGAISILSYSDRIYQFPLSIIGICFGTVLLPNLSKLRKEGKFEDSLNLQTEAIKLSLLLSIACMFGIISLAKPIMHVIYERGAFTSSDTINTANTISIFALGLPAFIINKVLTPLFYARLDTKTPLKITIVTILCNIILNLMLITKFKHLGIAIGTSIASWVNVALLIFYCRKSHIKILNSNITKYVIKLLVIGVIMALILFVLANNFSGAIYGNSSLIKFLLLIFLVSLGISLYFALSIVSGVIRANDLKNIFN